MTKKKKVKRPSSAAREKRFAAEYIVDRNGTLAAIRAGYSPGKDNRNAAVQAARMLKKPEVLALIQTADEALMRANGLSKENVINRLMEIYDRAMQKTPVLEWNSDTHAYEETGEWQFDSRAALRALNQVAELLGLKTMNFNVSPSQGVEEFLKQFGNKRKF